MVRSQIYFVLLILFVAYKKEELFKVADKNGDGIVSVDELAALLSMQQEK